MNIRNVKAVRTSDDRLFLFYFSGSALYCRPAVKGKNIQPEKIMDGVSPIFSVYCTGREIYVLLKSGTDFYICRRSSDRWIYRTISCGAASDCTKLSFFVCGEAVHLIYSVKAEGGREELYVRSMRRENWYPAEKVADILPFVSASYLIGNCGGNILNIYYRTAETAVKYRSINLENGSLSEEHPLISAKMPCIDISVVTHDNDCMMLYLARGMFSCQLIYKGIVSGSVQKARVIWEGQLSGSCSLFVCGSRTYALIYGDSRLYVMYSDKNGAFSPAKNMGAFSGENVVKAEYSSAVGGEFFADEIPVDLSDFSFPVTADICPNLVPEEKHEAVEAVRSAPTVNPAVTEEYEAQISALNSQISELSSALAKRNEEIAAVSARWRNRYEELKRQYEELKHMSEAGLSAASEESAEDSPSQQD